MSDLWCIERERRRYEEAGEENAITATMRSAGLRHVPYGEKGNFHAPCSQLVAKRSEEEEEKLRKSERAVELREGRCEVIFELS